MKIFTSPRGEGLRPDWSECANQEPRYTPQFVRQRPGLPVGLLVRHIRNVSARITVALRQDGLEDPRGVPRERVPVDLQVLVILSRKIGQFGSILPQLGAVPRCCRISPPSLQ